MTGLFGDEVLDEISFPKPLHADPVLRVSLYLYSVHENRIFSKSILSILLHLIIFLVLQSLPEMEENH